MEEKNNSNLYYINNYSMCAILSKIGAEQSFKMAFVGDGEYMSYLFGNNTKQGGYMVQISESMINTWFSRYGLQSIHPSMKDYIGMYLYVSGNRQVDDADIKLKDGVIKLSGLEKKVISQNVLSIIISK